MKCDDVHIVWTRLPPSLTMITFTFTIHESQWYSHILEWELHKQVRRLTSAILFVTAYWNNGGRWAWLRLWFGLFSNFWQWSSVAFKWPWISQIVIHTGKTNQGKTTLMDNRVCVTTQRRTGGGVAWHPAPAHSSSEEARSAPQIHDSVTSHPSSICGVSNNQVRCGVGVVVDEGVAATKWDAS